jgi:hypothetical protein
MTFTRGATVSVDPAATKIEGRVRYRITLACGCSWWEDREATEPPPDPHAMKCSQHPTAMPGDPPPTA